MFIEVLQYFCFGALAITFLLFAYLWYVRISQSRYTEKRFRFVALWACISLISLLFFYLFNMPPWLIVVTGSPIELSTTSNTEKILATIVVIFFIHKISSWTKSWNGIYTYNGFLAKSQGKDPSMLVDGFSETWRILRRQPPLPIYREVNRATDHPILPTPLPAMPYREQILELILGKWPEYTVDRGNWIEEAKCWLGRDTSLNRPLIVVCPFDLNDLDWRRLRLQINHVAEGSAVKVMIVPETGTVGARDSIVEQISEGVRALDLELLSFDKLLTVVLPLERYKQAINYEFSQKKLPNTAICLSDIFVEADVCSPNYENDPEPSRLANPENLYSYLEFWIKSNDARHVAILGDYGQGKSTAALELTHRILYDKEVAQLFDNRLPILIRLTGLNPSSNTPEELLGAWGTRYGFNGRALLALHAAGRSLLIFDAFDEMSGVSSSAERFGHFGSLWRFAGSNTRILFTGRPNFFLDDEELKAVLGIAEGNRTGPHCSAAYLQPFSDEKIGRSLRWLPENQRCEFIQTLKGVSGIREIAERPSLLFQLTQLWVNGRITIDPETLGSGTVIFQFVEYCLERQVAKQFADFSSLEYGLNFVQLRQSELMFFTMGCAVAALTDGRNNYLPEEVFKDTIELLWNSIEETDSFVRSAAEVGTLSLPLKRRFGDQVDPLEACLQAVRTHGVIEHDPARTGVYRFSHKSFAEVMAASVLVAGTLKKGDAALAVWRTMKPLELVRQRTIFRFCFELAKGKRKQVGQMSEVKLFGNILGKGSGLSAQAIYRIVFFSTQLNIRLWGSKFGRLLGISGRRMGEGGRGVEDYIFGERGVGKRSTMRIAFSAGLLGGIVTGGTGLGLGFFEFLDVYMRATIRLELEILFGSIAVIFGAIGLLGTVMLVQVGLVGVEQARSVVFCYSLARALEDRSKGGSRITVLDDLVEARVRSIGEDVEKSGEEYSQQGKL